MRGRHQHGLRAQAQYSKSQRHRNRRCGSSPASPSGAGFAHSEMRLRASCHIAALRPGVVMHPAHGSELKIDRNYCRVRSRSRRPGAIMRRAHAPHGFLSQLILDYVSHVFEHTHKINSAPTSQSEFPVFEVFAESGLVIGSAP